MPEIAAEIRAAVKQRFANIARSPDREKKFPVGPASAKTLGCDADEIDAVPPSVRFQSVILARMWPEASVFQSRECG